jgi:hypothetical protein
VKKISDFYDIDEAKKKQRERERRIKYWAQRAAIAAPSPPPTEPSPPPIPSKCAPRTKAECHASRGRKQSSTEPSVSTAPLPPTNQPKKRKQYQQTDSENLQKAVEYWDNFKGGDKITKTSVARMFGIERKTFANYPNAVWTTLVKSKADQHSSMIQLDCNVCSRGWNYRNLLVVWMRLLKWRQQKNNVQR